MPEDKVKQNAEDAKDAADEAVQEDGPQDNKDFESERSLQD